MDLVSIIMPSFNCGKYVVETIRSIQAQTYQNWEIIFVDDCSTDDTASIIRSIDEPRVRYFKNEHNSGAALSRNWALREARGRWIAFLDSDDLWEPTKLERQVHFMEENNYKFSYTCYSEMDEDGSDTGILISGPSCITKNSMFAFCWPGCLTVMYDREYCGLVQIENIKKNNDYAMWLKVCKKADCYLLDEPLAKYRRGRTGSVSTAGYSTLIKWHYKLFHDAEHMGVLPSAFHTCVNLICGVYKKLRYVKKYEVDT